MAITTEIVKKLTCDACGWECDNQECCPMRGKASASDVKELHPEFLWFEGSAYCEMNGCERERRCYRCGNKAHDPWAYCSDCEEFYCHLDECTELHDH